MVFFALSVLAQKKPDQKAPANFRYLFFREDCFDLFFNKFDFFSNKECLKVTISKGIGFAIVAGASILKVPQIMKILKA
jgi:hypothetical protein